jgi:SAM-dependent methyltransferase
MPTMQLSTSCSIPCNLCGSVKVETVRTQDRHGQPLRSVICCDCGLVWTDPRPSADRVRHFYEREYRSSYKGTYQPQPKHAFRAGKVAVDRFAQIRGLLSPGMKVLDVGAGSGEVVYVVRAMGYDATGFEPNEGYALYAAQVLKVPVWQAFYQDAKVAPESQDFVTLFHALEHLEDPYDAIVLFRTWLRSGGLLFIEVPNSEATCQQPHSQFHLGHLYHFNLPTLEALGSRAGFEVIKRATSEDGGNISVVFRKTDTATLSNPRIPGNFRRVSSILRRHTAFRHALSRHPYVRPFRKLAARIEERREANGSRSGRELLDKLIHQHLGSR